MDQPQERIISSIFHSPEVFKLNYAEMERRFKIFVYPDGDPNTYYHTPRSLSGKYTSEGYFFKNIRESRFLTNDPEKAHLFFIPISCHKMRRKVILIFLLCCYCYFIFKKLMFSFYNIIYGFDEANGVFWVSQFCCFFRKENHKK